MLRIFAVLLLTPQTCLLRKECCPLLQKSKLELNITFNLNSPIKDEASRYPCYTQFSIYESQIFVLMPFRNSSIPQQTLTHVGLGSSLRDTEKHLPYKLNLSSDIRTHVKKLGIVTCIYSCSSWEVKIERFMEMLASQQDYIGKFHVQEELTKQQCT